ncbi:MAG: hypothetical protein LBR13_04415 [Dysgonamonadaceae bacterium]|nr:hypothetical protein [Dysgonamonadaceae bacterium]
MKKLLFFAISALFFVACGEGGSSSSSDSGVAGQGGSMARFAIVGDYLYTVDNTNLKVFDVSNAQKPVYLKDKDQTMPFVGVETVFPLDTLLFIGTQSGMYIYDIIRPAFPELFATVSHITSCDPVVSDGKYAYVTLNSANLWCGRSVNVLNVYDLADIRSPQLLTTVSTFNGPKGLGLYGKKLYICDGGLKVYDVSNPAKPVWIDDSSYIPELTDSYDVIPLDNGILLLVGDKGFYEIDITKDKISLISQILLYEK